MTKTLRVIEPFFVMELGDTFEYSKDTNMYVSKHNEEFYKTDDNSVEDIKSSYNSEFSISVDYAAELVKEGYLEEATELENGKSFVNIFDEIDLLLNKYSTELDLVDGNDIDIPMCVKVERKTVLTNLITLLNHLKSLKK